MRFVRGAVLSFALSLVLVVGTAAALEPETTGDLFDINLGATVTDSSPNGSSSPDNMLGGTFQLIFADGQPEGTVFFVEWEVPTALPLAGFNLRAADDGLAGAFDFERSFDHVRLLADEGGGFEVFYESDVAIPYNGTPEQDVLLISEAVAPVVATRFRAEFTQVLECAFCGPRVLELDGFTENPCADGNFSGATTASDALIALTTSVGLRGCPLCACDVDGGGAVTATDALATLNIAVDLPFAANCPACLAVSDSTTTTTSPVTSTTSTTSATVP